MFQETGVISELILSKDDLILAVKTHVDQLEKNVAKKANMYTFQKYSSQTQGFRLFRVKLSEIQQKYDDQEILQMDAKAKQNKRGTLNA